MAFIGTPLDTRNTFQSLQGKRFSGDGSTTAFTLDVAPSSTLDIEVFVGNVRQDPNSAYTLSGTTLTFTGAPPSGTNNIYVVHQAKAVGTIGIPDDTISARTLVTADGDNDHILIHDATDGELKKALVPSSTADGFFATSGLSSKDLGAGLHIKTADSSASVSANADELVIEGSGNTGITIASGNTSGGNIFFADDGGVQRGKVAYDHNADSMTLRSGNNDSLIIDSTGAVTKPLQPAFLATIGSIQSNVADNTTLNFSSEIFDNNADFNTSNYTFTAPVTGKYFISFGVRLDNVDTASDYVRIRCITSNGTRGGAASIFDPGGLSGDPAYWGVGDSLLCDMDANDTATINFAYNNGAQQVDFPADNPEQTHFSAFLVC